MYTIYEGKTFDLPTENRNGFFWDTFRLEATAGWNNAYFDFEYRIYPGFNAHFIKKGLIGYHIAPNLDMQAGVVQVPFGKLEFLGKSWWFQLPYYVGLEDDYDTGLKFTWDWHSWRFHFAYFLMAEPRGVSEPDFGNFMSARYSYDVIPADGFNGNKERNQFNARAEYTRGRTTTGLSFQAGEIYNSNSGNSFAQFATALHISMNLSEQMSIDFQGTYYNYTNAVTDSGEPSKVIQMGAYGFGTYDVAAAAGIISVGLSYHKHVDWGFIEGITFYEDYSVMLKSGELLIDNKAERFQNSHHNVLGFLISAKFLYAYFDIASGINQPWLSDAFGGTALGSGRGEDVYNPPGPQVPGNNTNPIDRSPPVNTRFNINLGIYLTK